MKRVVLDNLNIMNYGYYQQGPVRVMAPAHPAQPVSIPPRIVHAPAGANGVSSNLVVHILSTDFTNESGQTSAVCKVDIEKGDVIVKGYSVELGVIGPGKHSIESMVCSKVSSINSNVLVAAAMMQHSLKLMETLGKN